MQEESLYAETVLREATCEGSLQRRTPAGDEFARVQVSVTPADHFHISVRPGIAPPHLIESIETGLLRALATGPSGFPLIRLVAVASRAAFHDIDSTPAAMEKAAELAGRTTLREAGPILLESISSVSVRIPARFGDKVTHDMSARRGAVKSVHGESEIEISADIPTVELEGFETHLKALTGGLAAFSSRFLRYEPLPQRLTAGFWCATCKCEVILPLRRGRPYRSDCPSCGGLLYPPDSPHTR